MKAEIDIKLLPTNAILLTCSSHEERCLGFLNTIGDWKPKAAVIFHYDDENPKRENNHCLMKRRLSSSSVPIEDAIFAEASAVESLRCNMIKLKSHLAKHTDAEVVLDISVFTKRHLLMMLRWLDDCGLWDRLSAVYTEPEDYVVSQYIPLSFGLSTLQQVPGFSATPDLSRPIHLLMFLGYEGDRALAVYEHVQPMRTTLLIPHPPYKPEWAGRTEAFNSQLIAIVGENSIRKIDAVDPSATYGMLTQIFGSPKKRPHEARIIAPLGTKPQTMGAYSYVRECVDSPAVLYASPLRHNHEYFSYGIGPTWMVKLGGGGE